MPESIFAWVLSIMTLDEKMHIKQSMNQMQVKHWKAKYHLEYQADQLWYKGRALVMPEDEANRWTLLEVYHDAPLAGHLGAAKTLKALVHDY